MKKLLIVFGLTVHVAVAQHEWVLQPWMQVEGRYNGQKLGSSVGFAGNVGDSAQITVGDVNGLAMYRIKSPTDTTPRFFFPGNNCILEDFNGDGIKDLAVGGNPTRIYLGKGLGIFDSVALFTKYQEANGYVFGGSVAAGNINGDQYDDLVVSDRGYPERNNIGRVYVFFGGIAMDTLSVPILQGEGIHRRLGERVAIGDLNNDGFGDIIVRGYDENDPINSRRYSYIRVYLGGESIDTAAWKYIRGTNDFGDLASFDANGDGVADLLWSNIDSLATVYIHFGKSNLDSIPNLKLKNPGIGGLGDVIVNGGDLNGDGYDDIVTGAPFNAQGLGAVLVYAGGPKMDANFDAAAGLSVESQFGYSVASIGDVNGDGIGDILVGAPDYEWWRAKGEWLILMGSTNIKVTAVGGQVQEIATMFSLAQNFPNPFNVSTRIRFTLDKESYITLKIYNILGECVETLISGRFTVGGHEKEFDAKRLSSGVYFYSLTSVTKDGKIQTETRTMTMLK